jgi:beta-lactamase regulating signal transducer with metallopeptidase domain
LLDLALVVWFSGAAIFLYSRFASYFRLRRDLLEDAREVGRTGNIRLIETPATAAPLAFGVRDKVIALPPGFMALTERTARDLALAHELAHHRGRDLAINFVVQPLFALHWWNPLGRYGWLALRRDQEAACDARVMATKPAEARVVYANVIAGFAAGPNLALAAPMACPVLGEKSIIERLRSLTMSDTSPRRRMAGRALLGAAVLALPLTASITYAEVVAPPAPIAPIAPVAPLAPNAPTAPVALLAQEIATIDPDTSNVEVTQDEEGHKVIIKKIIDEDGDGVKEKRIEKVHVIRKGEMTDEEIEEMMKGVRAGLNEAHKAVKDVPTIIKRTMIDIDRDDGDGKRTIFKMSCSGDGDEAATVKEGATRQVFICESKIMAEALEGLKEARAELAKETDMDAKIRDRVLQELDRQIEQWKKQKG